MPKHVYKTKKYHKGPTMYQPEVKKKNSKSLSFPLINKQVCPQKLTHADINPRMGLIVNTEQEPNLLDRINFRGFWKVFRIFYWRGMF